MEVINKQYVENIFQRLDFFIQAECKKKEAELKKLFRELNVHLIENPVEQKKEMEDIAKRFSEVEFIESGEACISFLHNDEGFKRLMLFGSSSDVDYFISILHKKTNKFSL